MNVNLEQYFAEADFDKLFQSRPEDEYEVFSQIEELDFSAFETINFLSAGNSEWGFMHLFSLACTLNDLKRSLSSASVSGLSVIDFDPPSDTADLAEYYLQSLISQHKALQTKMLDWQAKTAGYDAYAMCRDRWEEFDCMIRTMNIPQLLAAAIDRRPDLKEDIMEFAMQRDEYCNHARNFVDTSDRVCLAVFSSQQASKVCSRKVADTAKRFRAGLALDASAVTVLYITGTYTRTNKKS